MKSRTRWLVTFKPNPGARFRLLCIHYAGGGASIYRSWASLLSDDIELLAVQLPGREARFTERPFRSMAPLIDELTSELRFFFDRPYVLFGHSLGALIAFELIRAIRSRGMIMPTLFIPSGHRAPQFPERNASIYEASDAEFLERLRLYNGTPKEILFDEELMKLFLPRLRADFEVLGTYRYQHGAPLTCPIMAFVGTDDDNVNEQELNGWADQTLAAFRHRRFFGDHFFVKSAASDVVATINDEIQAIKNEVVFQLSR